MSSAGFASLTEQKERAARMTFYVEKRSGRNDRGKGDRYRRVNEPRTLRAACFTVRVKDPLEKVAKHGNPGDDVEDVAAGMASPADVGETLPAAQLPAQPAGGSPAPGGALLVAHTRLAELLHAVASILEEINCGGLSVEVVDGAGPTPTAVPTSEPAAPFENPAEGRGTSARSR
ncbi:unnamed protein product [Lampetra fluviatilis]